MGRSSKCPNAQNDTPNGHLIPFNEGKVILSVARLSKKRESNVGYLKCKCYVPILDQMILSGSRLSRLRVQVYPISRLLVLPHVMISCSRIPSELRDRIDHV